MSHRDDLLAGARRCLVEKGYRRTTARDIATASGAHLASIGYHFGSKDGLMATAVIAATDEWGTRLEQAARAAAAGRDDPAERLVALLTELVAALPEAHDLHVAGVQALGEAPFDAVLREALAAGMRGGREVLAELLLGPRAAGATPQAVLALGAAAYALVTGFIVQALVEPDALPDAPALAAAVRLLVPGADHPAA
ncbi:TetR/AcrR family transcriptional regulator [Pseudonocardia humida]|uniref:TetR/AcrR family transcriptional regulator n=1 Tax=Pseudonocardia humida TaxID=2800819 RepID=A0ABT1A605_9PSEU|nr:TetR/AcrR family transcriptional regulator [Pseudonocardia humida]MCO1658457.1 TetR/AcrR family transcriptional regulator [Pseudonocardia humida]